MFLVEHYVMCSALQLGVTRELRVTPLDVLYVLSTVLTAAVTTRPVLVVHHNKHELNLMMKLKRNFKYVTSTNKSFFRQFFSGELHTFMVSLFSSKRIKTAELDSLFCLDSVLIYVLHQEFDDSNKKRIS